VSQRTAMKLLFQWRDGTAREEDEGTGYVSTHARERGGGVLHTRSHAHTRTHSHTCTPTVTHAHTQSHTHIHSHTHTSHMHTQSVTHTYTVHTVTHVHTHTHTQITNAHSHTHTHHTHTVTHAHTQSHTQSHKSQTHTVSVHGDCSLIFAADCSPCVSPNVGRVTRRPLAATHDERFKRFEYWSVWLQGVNKPDYSLRFVRLLRYVLPNAVLLRLAETMPVTGKRQVHGNMLEATLGWVTMCVCCVFWDMLEAPWNHVNSLPPH